jgi:hypothetical protein
MRNKEFKEQLISDLERIDSEISSPMAAMSTSALAVGLLLLLADMVFHVSTNFFALALMLVSICVHLCARYTSDKAKKVLLEIHGLRCGNCGKTPQPAAIPGEFPIGYCPHCQLKYAPNDIDPA